MGDEWRLTTLGNVVRLQRGHDLPDKDRAPGRVPVMGSFGVTGWHNEARAKGPGVTIGRSGASIGVVSFIGEDYWPLNTCLYVTNFQGNASRFCYYWLSTLNLANYNSGRAQPSLNRNYIYGMPVRVPEAAEQRAIAHILGTLDDKIELNRRMNETLDAMARALFKSWFVDFDPIRAKMEGRWKPGQSLPGLPTHLYDLFPDRLVPSELGEIPEGWEMGTLDHFCILRRDGLNPSDYPDEVFAYYSIPAYDEGRLPQPETGSSIKSNKYVVSADSVLLSKLNPRIPRVWRPVSSVGHRSVCSTEFLVVVPKLGCTTDFLYCLFTSNSFTNEFATLVTGTSGSHQRVRPQAFLNIQVVYPPARIIAGFTSLVCGLTGRAAQARNECGTLAALRDTLLPKLISGQLRVKDAKNFLEGMT